MPTFHYALVTPADEGCRVRDDSLVSADGKTVPLPAKGVLPSGATSRLAPHRIVTALHEIHGADADIYFANGRETIAHGDGFKIGYYLGDDAATARGLAKR